MITNAIIIAIAIGTAIVRSSVEAPRSLVEDGAEGGWCRMRGHGGAGEFGRADGVSTTGVSIVIVLRPVVIVGGVGLILAAVVTAGRLFS